MNELIRLLDLTPSIDESDDVALRLPSKIISVFGPDCYNLIGNVILSTKDVSHREKLAIVLEEIPRLTDGVSQTFLDWCGNNLEELRAKKTLLRSVVKACLYWETAWRPIAYSTSVETFAKSIIDLPQSILSPMQRKTADWRIKRCRKRTQTQELLSAGEILIGDIELTVLREKDKLASGQVGFDCFDNSTIRTFFAGSLNKEPPQVIDRDLVRSTSEVSSANSERRVLIEAEWRRSGNTYRFENAFWDQEANLRRKELRTQARRI